MPIRIARGRARRPAGEVSIFGTPETRDELMTLYQDKLDRWPVPHETQFVSTRYGRTHVIASGDPESPPLVMIMGGGPGVLWSLIVPTVNARYRTFAIDTIGDVGRSELADLERYPRNGADYSDWLSDVWDGLGIDRADIVAGSMGCWMAMSLAFHAPARVRRMVLLAPMGLPSLRVMLSVTGPLASYALRPSPARRDWIVRRCIGDGETVNQEYGRWMRLLVEHCRPRLGNAFRTPRRAFRSITAPTLVIVGGQDRLIGSASAAVRRVRRHLPDAEVVVLPRAGHVMSIDEPEAVGELALQFLSRA